MNEPLHYYQEKKNKAGKIKSSCDLILVSTREGLVYTGDFVFNLDNKETLIHTRFFHELIVNKVTGDIQITHVIENDKDSKLVDIRSSSWTKKNDFGKLHSLCFDMGKKRHTFWGVKFKKFTEDVFIYIKEDLFSDIEDCFAKEKTYEDFVVSPLYDLIVDYHLIKKEIKYHDNVYLHILDDYPKKKWLKQNDNNFLPAILDSHGIKSKYFVGILSSSDYKFLNIRTLKYLCLLFGDNHLDYIRKFDWPSLCKKKFSISKFHTVKNESEKMVILKLIIDWIKKNNEVEGTPLEKIYKLFTIRTFLEEKGYDLGVKIKTFDQVEVLIEEWTLITRHLSLGYKLRYNIPKEVIEKIESPIRIGDDVFYPKVLQTQDEFIMEGIKMKNCLAKEFMHGAIYIYISLMFNNKKIDLQYQKGEIVQSYAKANTPIKIPIFGTAIKTLSNRMKNFSDLVWHQEKYDIISEESL